MHENTLEQSQHEVDALKNQLRTCQRKEAELFQKHLAAEAELQNRNGVLHESKVEHQAKKVKKAEDELHEAIEQFKEASKENDLLEWKLTEKQQLLERRDAENRSERERLGKLYTERMEAQRASLHEEHERLEE
jgi:hypothetical protein